MIFFTRQRWIFLLAAVMAITAPEVSYAQLGGLKEKAIETLTNGVMKELEKKFTEVVAKEAISAAAKAIVVSKLSEMSRPIVKKFIDSATSGKLPNQAELVNAVLKDIIPRVPELVAAARMEGDSPDAKIALTGTAGSVAQITGQVQTAINTQLQNNYDDEKDFTSVVINEGSAVRITKYVGKKTDVNIPPLIGNLPVTEIGDQAFIKKGLTSVVIPDSVLFIGNMAFAENQIGSVSIGANVYITNNSFESSGYNSFSAVFYNSQGRKAGTYTNSWRLASSTTTGKTPVEETQSVSKSAAPASSQKPASNNPPVQKMPVDTANISSDDDDAKLRTIGVSMSTAFIAPRLVGTVHGTFTSFNNSFIELGMDIGGGTKERTRADDDIDYFSVYPFINYALFLPFSRTASGKRGGGWYMGAGIGYMLAKYTFNVENPSQTAYVWDGTLAMNIVTGFNLFDIFDISYTIRTNFKSIDSKLTLGIVYRFK